MKHSFSRFRFLSMLLAVSFSLALVGSGGKAWAANDVQTVFVCVHANGEIRLVPSADQCGKPKETLLGGIVTTRLEAVVSPAGANANPGDSVPFTGSNVSSVVFLGTGAYCVFPANPSQFNLSYQSPPPTFFVRTAKGDKLAPPTVWGVSLPSLCNVVAGGPVGFSVEIYQGYDEVGVPIYDNDLGFVIEVP